MGELRLYSVFHINLAFSSIPKSHYSLILDRCYWPLLDVALRMNIPFGFEASGYSLEQLEKTDHSFVTALKEAWANHQIEFIGSGYVQNIMPLCPASVNRENLRIGHTVYQDLLGQKPVTAYVNEQTYSSGLVDLYLEAGYQQLIMEYNNPARFHAYPPDTAYHPQKVLNPDGSQFMTMIWNNSISFQKLQRYLSEDLPQEEYLNYLESHFSQTSRGMAFYGSDAEIIDYHPGNLDAAYHPPKSNSDLKRLVGLLDILKADSRISWTTPQAFAQTLATDTEPIRLESSEYPLPCKKQTKYNPTRWAVCGRDNSLVNTTCYHQFLSSQDVANDVWRKILETWGSDFRTHTTDEKSEQLRQTTATLTETLKPQFTSSSPESFSLRNPNNLSYEGYVTLEIHFPSGILFGTPHLKSDFAVQIEGLETYQDGSIRWMKTILHISMPAHSDLTLTWESSDPIQASPAFDIIETAFNTTLKTDAVTLKLIPKRGGAIESLQFNQLDSKPWVGTIPHGWFEDIALGADFYSGHFILASKTGEKATDLQPAEIQLPLETENYPIRVPVRIGINTAIGSLWKTYYLYRHEPRVDLLYHFRFRDIAASSCRVGIMTVLPDAFDPNTLAYSTVNGGLLPERFPLKGHHVTHDEPVSITVSAQHGLGATEGWVAIEDKDKRLLVKTYPHAAYAMPMIHYEESPPGYFLRLLPSIGEFDDTSHTLRRGHHQVMFTWQGQKASQPIQALMPPVSLSSHVSVLAV